MHDDLIFNFQSGLLFDFELTVAFGIDYRQYSEKEAFKLEQPNDDLSARLKAGVQQSGC